MALLTDELKSWIGREVQYVAPEPLSTASIRYFASALRDDNPLYRDDEFARDSGHPSVIAPPTLVCETCQYVDGQANDDGYLGHEWDLPLTHCRLIRAGNDYEFLQPVLASDVITAKWTLESIDERSRSKGGTQLFVVSLAQYFNQDGTLLATNRETVVYQPIA
ncbi:MAG: MaoC family dehydratase N-terminal domain-containing protein [Pseudomonadota bacterium]